MSTIIFQKYKTIIKKQTTFNKLDQFPSSEVELRLMGPVKVGATWPFYHETETDLVSKFYIYICISGTPDDGQSPTGVILDCHHVRYTITMSYN